MDDERVSDKYEYDMIRLKQVLDTFIVLHDGVMDFFFSADMLQYSDEMTCGKVFSMWRSIN